MPSFTKLSAIFLSLTLALSVSARPTQSTQPRSQSANKPGDRSQTRSMVITRGGIVAAESPLAAQVGAQILAHGGNAIDAIVATNAAIGVIEPMMNGIGGDLFAIVYDAKTEKALRPQRLRLGSQKSHHRISEIQGHRQNAPNRHQLRHRSRRGRRLGPTPLPLRHQKIPRSPRARHRTRPQRVSRRRMGRLLLVRRGKFP